MDGYVIYLNRLFEGPSTRWGRERVYSKKYRVIVAKLLVQKVLSTRYSFTTEPFTTELLAQPSLLQTSLSRTTSFYNRALS